MLLLKSVLLGLAAFAVYTLLYLVYAVYPGPHGAVTTNVIWIYTIGNPMSQESGVALTGKKTEPSAETSRRHAAAGGACDEGRQDRQEALCNDWADQRYTVRKQRRTVMTQKVIEVVGTSTESFAKAAENAVAEAAQTVRGLKWARVAELEMELDGKKITQYRATAKIYFDIEH